MSPQARFPGRWASFQTFGKVGEGSAGYALSFKRPSDAAAIVGGAYCGLRVDGITDKWVERCLDRGYLDFTDTGIADIAEENTICVWTKWDEPPSEDGQLRGSPWSITSHADTNLYSPINGVFGRANAFGGFADVSPDLNRVDVMQWFQYCVTWDASHGSPNANSYVWGVNQTSGSYAEFSYSSTYGSGQSLDDGSGATLFLGSWIYNSGIDECE